MTDIVMELFDTVVPVVREHRVLPGENLATIAKHYYGTSDSGKQLAIWRHNKHKVADPNQVFPGTVLVIPHFPHG